MRRRIVGSEEDLSFTLARYLQVKYPYVMYHFDFGSGVKLSMGQAVKNKKLNRRAWPDLFIAEERHGYNGLFLELKREGVKVYKKDGSLVANEHYREQADTLANLKKRGYVAEFAFGLDDAIKQIDDYFS